jgi:hypothetical protein
MMNRRTIALVAVSLAALALTACSTKEVNQPTATTSAGTVNSTVATTPSSSTPPTTKPSKATAHVGATLTLTGDNATAAVTLTQVINPATGADGPPTDDNGNPNGDTYVATLLTVKNTGTQSFQGDANSDSTLIGSNDQSYTADFDDVNECTNFNSGSYQLGAGESATGCVVFVLPAGVTPAKFQYSPDSGFSSNFGEWLIP